MTKRGGLTKGEEAELKTLYGKRNNLTGQIRKSQVNAYFEKLTGVSNDTLEKEIKRRENLLAAMKVNGKKYGKIIQGSKSLTGIYSNDELQYQLRNGVWVKLETANANGISGINTNEITVPASAVVNVGIFKCVIKDTDTASATANKEVFAIGTLYDGSDPYEIDVFQPNDDNVAEGGSLLHWFKIRQGATYITDAVILGAHNMRVWRFAANNAIDTTWGTSGYKACTKDAPNARFSLDIAYTDLLSASQAFCVELY